MNDTSPERSRTRNQLLIPLRIIYRYLRSIVLNLVHLKEDTDTEGTIEGIKSGIVLKGSQLWILVCSTIIACIGLDVNSPAVIIGAMLISPLMSPILGIGLASGINDRRTLASALSNFGIAMGLSLLVSFLYFKLTPFGELTAEMQSRTAPTILDAFVALFGGLAGIIAGSRTNKSNAIPGVAIATALMPPLCTAGFGLSNGLWEVFGGAFYLFFINAVLISLSTYLIVRLLRFPFVAPTEQEKSALTKRIIYFFIFLLLIPSFYFLYNTLTQAARNRIITDFIQRCIHEDVQNAVQWTYQMENDSTARLKVYYFGQYIRDDSVSTLENNLKAQFASVPLLKYNLPSYIDFNLIPTDAPPDEEKEKMNAAIIELQQRIGTFAARQEQEMQQLEDEVSLAQLEADSLQERLTFMTGDTLQFNQISAEVQALFPELSYFSLGKTRGTNFESERDIQVIAVIIWKKELRNTATKRDLQNRLRAWLAMKTGTEQVSVFTE